MKNWEDCKNEVARKYHFGNWDELLSMCSFNGDYRPLLNGDHTNVIEEAALLYGEAKWKEGCEEQLKLVGVIDLTVPYPKPPFKP